MVLKKRVSVYARKIMSDWKCEVVRIEKIEKHPNANSLSIATVLGDYPVVIKTGEYNVNDLVGYISIDTIVPDSEYFHFLTPRLYERYEEDGEIKQRQVGMKYMVGSVPENKRIVKSKKFFGVYSQGLIIPAPSEMKEGDSLVELLSLKKLLEAEEENTPGLFKVKGGNAIAAPKDFSVPYYDLESLRKYLTCLHQDEEVCVTEKLHGFNCSFTYDGEKLWCKSRNFFKREDADCEWWQIAEKYSLKEKLSLYPKLSFFGEGYGKVKGYLYDNQVVNGKLLANLRLFDIYDTVKQRFLDYKDFVKICDELNLPRVPELYVGKIPSKEKLYLYAEGLTTLGGKHIREGIVVKTVKERFEPKLNSRMAVKLIGEGYNLKK